MNIPDFAYAPNQSGSPAVYELENAAIDPDGVLYDAMRRLAPWDGQTLLDLGCGSGWWLPRYADEAASVIGVEPDETLLPLAAARDARVRVLHGSAEHIPLEDERVDVVHARFAYFFGAGREAGLTEVRRVLRPGGRLVVVANDLRQGEFAALLRAAGNTAEQAEKTDNWWASVGAARVEVMSGWQCPSPDELASILAVEFPGEVSAGWLAAHPRASGLTYGYLLFAVGRD